MIFDFKDLVIFEMANNHQGNVRHGLRIIEEMAKITRRYNLRAALKLQYRDLDTFIHADYRARAGLRHIPRFLETRLKWEELQSLVLATHDLGMLSIITCFDESSISKALDHGVDALKVASCSALDWLLLEALAKTGKPLICSTGGCRLAEVDKIVSFFEHREVKALALLHCVSTYPTEDKDQQLHFMQRLMQRYPQCAIGYSGHEAPENLRVVIAAVSMGAQILERHVGLPSDTTRLNSYSMDPEQTARWVEELLAARRLCGPFGGERIVPEAEELSLASLRRGVWARRGLGKGETITRDAIYLATPAQPGQTTAQDYLDSMMATRDYAPHAPIQEARLYDPIYALRQVVHEAKGLLREARIHPGEHYQVELSHHYGMDQFRRFGATIVSLVNREYCKKLIILLPGQVHPSHAHRKKEETFQILHGELDLALEGEHRLMRSGHIQLIKRGQIHSFSTKSGCVIEEISTTHLRGDSVYEDERIARLDPVQRKTVIASW